MRLWAEFSAPGVVRLPVYYNHAVQGLIYRLLPDEYRRTLHDEGYVDGKRSLKLFTFSRIFGKVLRAESGIIVFQPPVRLCIGSPVERFVSELANRLIKEPRVQLAGNELQLASVEFPKKPPLAGRVEFYTLSPITVYSTLYTADGRKKTYYYSPQEREFSELITANLLRKYRACRGEEVKGGVRVTPLRPVKERVVVFKGTVIKAWSGRFVMEGDTRLIETAYEAGAGSKNSAGFGMIEVVGGA